LAAAPPLEPPLPPPEVVDEQAMPSAEAAMVSVPKIRENLMGASGLAVVR
jgi:hypothetical protein